MHVPADKCRKLDAKATEVVLVGCEADAKGYKLWDKRTHSQRLSRDVTFDESSFPNLKTGVETLPTHHHQFYQLPCLTRRLNHQSLLYREHPPLLSLKVVRRRYNH